MNKILFIINLLKNYIKTLWVYRTGIQVYNEQDLYNAVDKIQNRPFWKAKSIVIRADHLILDRNITVYNTIYFTKNFKSMTEKLKRRYE